MMNRMGTLALAAAAVAGLALAQDEDLPLRNWGAPPYWTPPVVAKESGPEGEMQASAQGMTATAQSLPSSPLPFVAIAPCRIVDTRVNVSDGFHEPNFSDNETRTFTLPSSTDCPGLPATSGAWSLNVQFRPLSQLSFITLFPTGTTMPTVSTLTASPAAWVQNAAVVPAGTGGGIDVYCQYAGRVVIDVNGYYGPQSVVTSLNTLAGALTLAPGSNVTITPSSSTLTIAATGGPGGDLPAGSTSQTLRNTGSAWVASSVLTNDGTNVGIAGNVVLPYTGAGGTSGVITVGGYPFLHDYAGPTTDGANTFLGQGAGNFTMGGIFLQDGSYNVGLGAESLAANTTGAFNTAVGVLSLYSNTTGISNTATGTASLGTNTTGSNNTATGGNSLLNNTTGFNNTATGYQSLNVNGTGYANTANGYNSLYANSTGYNNTAVGTNAGNRSDTITGYDNVSQITFVPSSTGSWNTFVGEGTGATAQVDNCTAVGVDAYCTATNQVRLGNRFVSSIGGEVAWSALSDLRAKTDVRDLDLGLDFVMALRPVEYRLKSGNGKTDMGFVAQDIEALLGDGYNLLDIGGDPERTLSLRHTDLIAPLVKAVQEQQRLLEAQQAEIQDQRGRIAAQQTEIEALKAQGTEIQELRRQVQMLMADKQTVTVAQANGH
jgi:hypothetical protein